MSRTGNKTTYRGYDSDEELTSVGVGPRICHAQRVWAVVAEGVMELVFKFAAPNTLTTCTVACNYKRE